jgi:DNA-directed RNA polymerase specialized sigma24 family protein
MGLGDQEAFTDFVRSHEPKLRIALMSSYGPERGREATAEAFAYAWEHWEKVRDMKEPVGYLYRVGQSKSRPRLTPRPDPVPAERIEPWVEPALPTALNRLSRKQRMAVVLVHGYGWGQQEAADVMSVSEATVRTHLRRGLSHLRSALGVSSDA